MNNDYKNCTLCPRKCGIDRTIGQTGFCGQTNSLTAAKAYLHLWEEPCLSGKNGSGTVFFCGCNLKCVYCQNYEISRSINQGAEISAERLCEIYFELKQKGACNINLVTPTHFMPHIKKSITLAKQTGFDLPFVYNTSGYENTETVKRMDGLIDIYLTDIKYYSNAYAARYSRAKDYFKYAFSALTEMFDQQSKLIFDSDKILKRGVIARHLILPDMTADSKRILSALYNKFGNNIIYSLMSQYTPVMIPKEYYEINRTVTVDEYETVVDYAYDIGIQNCYTQLGESCSESFIPVFNKDGILPNI